MRSNRTSRAALAFTVALYLTGCPAPPPEVEEDTKAVTETVTEAVTAIDAFIAEQTIDKNQEGWKLRLPKPPKVGFAADKSYFWNLETNKGNIRVKLLPNVAPMHVSSTLYLTQLGFYDGVIFHRVITGFMAQGGDPTGTGRGGPGYEYAGEFDPSVKHDRPGMLSMANAGPNTDGSQFFLTFLPTPHLDGKHTIFGEVVEGMETVKTLEKLGSRRGKPSEKLFIKKATVSVESTTRTGGNQEEAATDISAAASRKTPSA